MRAIVEPLGVTVSIQVSATLTFLAVPVLAPAMAGDLGVDPGQVGIYASLVFLGAMFGSMVSGTLLRRHGAIRVCQVGLMLAAVAAALIASGWLWLIVATAALIGCGYGPATPAASHILARETPARWRGLVFSLKQSGVPLGGMLAGAVLPALALMFGWQATILLVSATVLAVVTAVQPIRARYDRDRDPSAPIELKGLVASLLMVLRRVDLRRLAGVCMIFSAVQMSLFAVLVVYMVEVAGLDLIAAGLVYAVMQISGVVARPVWGWVSDRVLSGAFTMAGIGLAASAFFVLLILVTPDWPFWSLVAIAGLLGFTSSGWNGIALAEIARLAPDQVAIATSGTVVFIYGGVALGPSTFSLLAILLGGFEAAFAVMAALNLVAVVVLFTTRGEAPPTASG